MEKKNLVFDKEVILDTQGEPVGFSEAILTALTEQSLAGESAERIRTYYRIYREYTENNKILPENHNLVLEAVARQYSAATVYAVYAELIS